MTLASREGASTRRAAARSAAASAARSHPAYRIDNSAPAAPLVGNDESYAPTALKSLVLAYRCRSLLCDKLQGGATRVGPASHSPRRLGTTPAEAGPTLFRQPRGCDLSRGDRRGDGVPSEAHAQTVSSYEAHDAPFVGAVEFEWPAHAHTASTSIQPKRDLAGDCLAVGHIAAHLGTARVPIMVLAKGSAGGAHSFEYRRVTIGVVAAGMCSVTLIETPGVNLQVDRHRSHQGQAAP